MAANPNQQLSIDVVLSSAIQDESSLNGPTAQAASNRQDAAQRGQTGETRRVAPDAADPNRRSSSLDTRYIAPASFLTQMPGPRTGSLDEVIASYMMRNGAPATASSCPLVRFPDRSSSDLARSDQSKSRAGRVVGRDNDRFDSSNSHAAPSVETAIAEYKRSADYAAGLSLAVTLTQSFNSSVKRLTQGQ